MNAFEEMCGPKPSAKATATAKAAHDVVYGKAGLVRACAHFHVREQAVIKSKEPRLQVDWGSVGS